MLLKSFCVCFSLICFVLVFHSCSKATDLDHREETRSTLLKQESNEIIYCKSILIDANENIHYFNVLSKEEIHQFKSLLGYKAKYYRLYFSPENQLIKIEASGLKHETIKHINNPNLMKDATVIAGHRLVKNSTIGQKIMVIEYHDGYEIRRFYDESLTPAPNKYGVYAEKISRNSDQTPSAIYNLDQDLHSMKDINGIATYVIQYENQQRKTTHFLDEKGRRNPSLHGYKEVNYEHITNKNRLLVAKGETIPESIFIEYWEDMDGHMKRIYHYPMGQCYVFDEAESSTFPPIFTISFKE